MLKTVWQRLARPADARQVAGLPAELRDHVLHQHTGPLVGWLTSRLARDQAAPELDVALDAVRQAGWDERDVRRLAVASLLGAGHWGEVVNRAAGWLTGNATPDPELAAMTANALYHLNRFEEAERLMSTLDADQSNFASRPDWARLAAVVAWSNGRMEEAKRRIDLAYRLAPEDPAVILNAYLMNFEYGDDAMVAALESRLPQAATDAGMAVVRATVELARGHYEAGFELLESRYDLEDAWRYFNPELLGRPRWRGECLAGRVILVSTEQGLGDNIQMARFLPMLAALGASMVILEAPPEALSLLQASFPEIHVVERKLGVPPPLTFDLWTGLTSLPHRLGTTAATVPARAGYLKVPHENHLYWTRRVAELANGRRPRIGLAWSGQRANRGNRRRSIPVELLLAAIGSVDADFFSLQKESPAFQLSNLIDVADELQSLADTAALIEQMDLVVSVCSCPVHLAGALGKETWLLVPRRWEWRWGLDGEGNHWYDSVKVMRQRQHDDWNELLDRVFGVRLPLWMKQQGRR